MKRILICAAILIAGCGFSSHALDLKNILGQAGTAASGVVEGLLTQKDITVEQMAGTWTATGSAVAFQSEDFLKKAGGDAAAKTLEQKLDPYFQKYGLTGSTLTIEEDGSFVLKIKSLSLKGTIEKRSDGDFDFVFKPFGNMKLGSVRAYVQKPIGGLDVMFDANKIKSLLSAILGLTGNSMASTFSSALESYDGLCIGFTFSGTGTSSGTNGNSNQNASDIINNAGGLLKNILGK